MSVTVQYTVFDKVTGRVLHCGSCSDYDLQHQNFPNSIIVGGFYDPDLFYMDVETQQVHPKLIFPGLEDETVPVGQVLRIEGIPLGTMVTIDDQPPVVIDDGDLEIEPEHVGLFRIKMEGLRIVKWEGTFDAY